jgi:undecaprenyl pyrophosphate phosphatase UppP
VLAITLDEAMNIAVGLVVIFTVGAIAAAWIMKTIMQKVAVAAVFAVLAFAVWTQRQSLQDCADKVKDAYEFDGVNTTILDTDCSFFGTTITISDPRSDPPGDAAG